MPCSNCGNELILIQGACSGCGGLKAGDEVVLLPSGEGYCSDRSLGFLPKGLRGVVSYAKNGVSVNFHDGRGVHFAPWHLDRCSILDQLADI